MLVTFDDVSVSFEHHSILREVSFQVEPGEFVSLVGESGSGKSSLLRMIYMDLMPARGMVRVGEYSSKAITADQIPFLRRLPKRGFTNPNSVSYSVVNVGFLEKNFTPSAEVDQAVLRQRGAIGSGVAAGLKILGDGELTKPLTVKANKFSASARKKIEAAGGKVTLK